jgi:glycosyltransferase involved in cell wall biosynthesis
MACILMRILFLTQWFQPESFFKGLPFAKALKDKGHEIEVLTGFPNYPGGKVYAGYRIRLYQQELMDGIKVHRVPLYPSHDKSALGRIVNYLSFSLSAFLMGPWLVKKPDVIYVYNLVTLGLPAFVLRFLYGSKVIIDVQDLWPESVASSGMLGNKNILRVLNGLCNWVYRKADQLVVLSPGFKNHLVNRSIPQDKIKVIYNWCNETDMQRSALQSETSKSIKTTGKFVVLYAGAMGVVQGLDTLLNCADICRTELPDVQFFLIGDGADRSRLEQMATERKLDNVVFLPRRSIETMGEIIAMADALIVHLKDDPLFRITIPSKTQAYLYMGKPVIMAVHGDAAALIEEAKAGIVCEQDNPLALADAIRLLCSVGAEERSKMGDAGYRYYMQHLSFEKGINNFEQVMFSLLEQKNNSCNRM